MRIIIFFLSGCRWFCGCEFLRAEPCAVAREDILRRFPVGAKPEAVQAWLVDQHFTCTPAQLYSNPRIGFAKDRDNPLIDWEQGGVVGLSENVEVEPRKVMQVLCQENWGCRDFMYSWGVTLLLDDDGLVFDVMTQRAYDGL